MKIKSFLLLICSFIGNAAMALPDQVILFRHAEKQAGSNPDLTAQGQKRAEHLVTMLSKPSIKHLFSTDYKRTQQTIAPLSKRLSLPVQSYDPRKLPDFAKQLTGLSGTVVVAGHSNTTPMLVELLSGQKVTIDESQFDKVFVLDFGSNKETTLTTLSSNSQN